MRRPWLVYLITALAACAAGVAIAGLPSGGSGDAVVFVPVTTSSPTTTATSTTTSTATSTTTTPPPTAPATSTTAAPTTSAPTTTTSEPAPTTTSPPAPTTTSGAVPSDDPLNEVRVVVANGAGVAGLAGSAADVLRSAGFGDVSAANTGPAPASVVFFDGDELAAAAALIIDELGLPADAVGERDDAPAVDADGEFDIVVVLGADRVP